MLELVEEALDQIALAVNGEIDHATPADIALRRDVGRRTGSLDQLDDRAGEEPCLTPVWI
jgi:hypothetical protein